MLKNVDKQLIYMHAYLIWIKAANKICPFKNKPSQYTIQIEGYIYMINTNESKKHAQVIYPISILFGRKYYEHASTISCFD